MAGPLKPGKIAKIADILKNLKLCHNDKIVIDAMANSAFLGTDKDGLPVLPAKPGKDGRYHLIGYLQLAPISAFRTSLKRIDILLKPGGGGGGGRGFIKFCKSRICKSSVG
jgi:hypothetical protein